MLSVKLKNFAVISSYYMYYRYRNITFKYYKAYNIKNFNLKSDMG